LLAETVTHIPGPNVSGKLDDRVGLHYTVSVRKEVRHPRMRFHVVRDEKTIDHYAAAQRGGVTSQKAWSEGHARSDEALYKARVSPHHATNGSPEEHTSATRRAHLYRRRRRRSRGVGPLVNGSWANDTWTSTALNASLANASLLGSGDRTAQSLADVSRSVALTEVAREERADPVPVLGKVSDDMPLDAQQNKAAGMAEAFGGAALAMTIGMVAFHLYTSHGCRRRPRKIFA
jgi:hypothetical protein